MVELVKFWGIGPSKLLLLKSTSSAKQEQGWDLWHYMENSADSTLHIPILGRSDNQAGNEPLSWLYCKKTSRKLVILLKSGIGPDSWLLYKWRIPTTLLETVVRKRVDGSVLASLSPFYSLRLFRAFMASGMLPVSRLSDNAKTWRLDGNVDGIDPVKELLNKDNSRMFGPSIKFSTRPDKSLLSK